MEEGPFGDSIAHARKQPLQNKTRTHDGIQGLGNFQLKDTKIMP